MNSKQTSSSKDLESALQQSIEKISLEINDYFSDIKDPIESDQTLKKKPGLPQRSKFFNSNLYNLPSRYPESTSIAGSNSTKVLPKCTNFEPLPKIPNLSRGFTSNGVGKVKKMMQSIEAEYSEKMRNLKEIRNKAQNEMTSIKERINKEKKGKLEHLLLNRKNRFNVPNEYVRGFRGFKKNLFSSFGRL